MFGTSQIVFAVVPFGRVLKRCGWVPAGSEGQDASESIFSENPRLRHPYTIEYLLRRCVSPQTSPENACKRELFVKRLLTKYDWRIFNDEG